MSLTLLEVKNKVKEELKKTLDIDDFRIVFADKKNDMDGVERWIIGINFDQEVISDKTKERIHIPSSRIVTIDAETGEIVAVSSVRPISKVKL
jgi:hypothetical protein